MKKFLSVLLVLALLPVLFAPATALADYDYDSIPTPHMIVVDGDNPSVVFYERAADEKVYPASTTKIMTCLIALEYGNLDDEFMVGEEVLGTTVKFTSYSSLMGLEPGETVTLRDLVYGLMLVSGNDAGEAIAKHVAGSIDAFVTLMNNKAADLGMSGTHYTNPHGVHNDDHYTTARDMAKLASYALQNQDFCDIVETKEYTVPANNVRTTPLELKNTDRLLVAVEGDSLNTVYQYAIGIKTGDTDKAGKCLVAAAEKDGARVIVAMFGDTADLYNNDKETTNLARFVNAASIFEYVFDNDYQTVTGTELGLQKSFSSGVVNGDEADLSDGQLTMSADLDSVVIRALADRIEFYKTNASSITANVLLTTEVKAPIIAGQSMGSVEYSIGNEVICTAPLTADFAVDEMLEMESIQPQETAAVTESPDATPLITKGHKEWGTADVLTLVFVLLIVLLAALIIVFVISERKRRYERKRRSARARQRKYRK
ncbi:MAG TPA: D-alanyl-D-alanine carboxypeptidase family protein [Eubacteriales bacterium]|mgnify:CR=1 FL=1|nr:D-alanyl-D-alanine carboxypeptidase family protein [Eubacteriales bacterium]